MGCKVSNFSGGGLKYKETSTKTISRISSGTTEDLYTASRPCFTKIRVKSSTYDLKANGNLYINGAQAAGFALRNRFTNLVERQEIFTPIASDQSESKACFADLVVLLDTGGKLQFRASSELTNIVFEIFVYVWE